jgi:signal transduction histidine kinase/CheY-like chemotaxis protein
MKVIFVLALLALFGTESFAQDNFEAKQLILNNQSFSDSTRIEAFDKLISHGYRLTNDDSVSRFNIEKIQQLEIQHRRTLRGILLASIIIIALAGIAVYSRITALKRHEVELEQQKQRAEISEKHKEEFLANMSHEIRTPMHAISGMTKILKRNPHDESQNVYLDAIDSSSENLLIIVNDILDLSKIESGMLHMEQISLNPGDVLKNVFITMRYRAEEKGLALDYHVAHDVPTRIMGDPNRLNQILINLVGNAIKFTEKGNVSIELFKTGDHLLYKVTDTGIGIPPEKQGQIFQAFEQAGTETSGMYGGTGLGLSITNHLVELLGGQILLKSEVGKGSAFSIQLPLVTASDDVVEHTILTEDQLMSMADKLTGIRILLAEDNEFNLMIAQDDLNHYIKDVQIDVAKNGIEALKCFGSSAYDLILMDVQMPELNGYEATEEIRRMESESGNRRRVPIIAMTASVFTTELTRCYQVGMDDYIPKPYSVNEFLGNIYNSVYTKETST